MPRSITTKARVLRTSQTDAERALWRILRLRQFAHLKFRRQRPVGPYIVDFVCLERHLVVEVDGSQHVEQEWYDRQRTRYLSRRGYEVVRFTNREVLKDLPAVAATIWQALEPPPPSPSP